jgi:hypothetical protein
LPATCSPGTLVPRFLDAAWFEGFSANGERHRDWFAHIGIGQNIRTAPGLPVRLTKMQAHQFLLAPDGSTIVAALRWGQTLGLDGNERTAHAIAESRLGRILPDEAFWAGVIHFFVNNAAAATGTAHIGPIVDFIWHRKFGDTAAVAANGQAAFDDAPEPNFSMKGRTLAALQERVAEWHDQLARDAKRPRKDWAPCGLDGFQTRERDGHGAWNTWTIRELLDSRALQEEGREMRHCVFTYASGCSQGKSSIWSLRVRPDQEAQTRRLLTIEVNNARRAIVQVRGRCNQTLGACRNNGRMKTAGHMLRRWAREQRLSIACAL